MRRRINYAVQLSLLALVVMSVVTACRAVTDSLPTAPSSSSASTTRSGHSAGVVFGGVSAAVTFPPRNEPLLFRQALEVKYRDGLRRPANSSFVDVEGDIVWTSEYLRYRVNRCSHAEAVDRVMRMIDNPSVIPPVCGEAPPGPVEFPPRNEPLNFRNQLEVKYRDDLRRSAQTTFVDLEGDIVWTQEYFRYRVNECDHTEAQTKVMQQIDTGVVQTGCFEPVDIRARITGPTATFNANTNVTFSGLGSSSNKGPIVLYQWNCGQAGNTSCSASSPTPTFRYNRHPGIGTTMTYNVTLFVQDSQGNRSSTTSYQVRVTSVYP